MGEVYVARDTRLNRRVAIKVLSPALASDSAHLTRFAREAKAASGLNHPNIVAVYDVGESDSGSYVAMELIEGKTLAEQIASGPLSIKRVLDIGIQIADGLAAAHEAGIVHRDLKPANVMVTREGFAKILDFGLARNSPATSGGSSVETEPAPPTQTGEIVGTAGYMSPEQARGEPVDFRSDQFSFGSVLYEMATGRRAFRGNTRIDTLSAVLNNEPEPIAKLRPGVPAPLRWVIERCHAKASAERYHSTPDLAREVRGIREHLSEVSDSAVPKEPASRRRRLGLLLGGVGAAVLIGAALWLPLRGAARHPPEPQFRRLTFRSGDVERALFTPNSTSILYTAAWDGQTVKTYLTLPDSRGADRSLEGGDQLPLAYSPDGSLVLALQGAFRATVSPNGELAWWPSLGGKPRRILDRAGWSDWASRGQFFAAVRDAGAERVLEILGPDGAVRRSVYRTPGSISFVRIAPDEKHVVFIHHPNLLGSSGGVRVVAVDGSDSRALTPSYGQCFGLDWNAQTGEVWFTSSQGDSSNTVLQAVGLAGKLRLLYVFPDRYILQSVAATGDRCLVIWSQERAGLTVRHTGKPPQDLSWFGWTLVDDLSPDGRFVLFYDSRTGGASGSWMRPLEGGEATPLGDVVLGKFSPDGQAIIGLSTTEPPQLVLAPIGTGKSRQLTSDSASHSAPAFVDSRTVLFVRSEADASGVWAINVDGTGAHSLNASGCDLPAAHASSSQFLCVGGERNGTLFVYPMQPGSGRRLFALPVGDRFRYARWNRRGDRIFGVTGEGDLLTFDAASGAVLRQERLPAAAAGGSHIMAAALNDDATIQAYSTVRFASDLYLVTGIR